MELGRFYREVSDAGIAEILSRITQNRVISIRQICERYGDTAEDVRYYDAYAVKTDSGDRVLKKTVPREAFLYETYLMNRHFSVPSYYGKWVCGDTVWILIEDVSGEDLRDMTDTLALAAADSLAQIQNAYWQQDEEAFSRQKSDGRFEVYWRRLLRRADSVAELPRLRKAYQCFLDRQLTCPRTLSNGDFLQFNAVRADGRVVIIDWGFGGIMPYALDIARFLAHATEDRSTFPFYMNRRQKELFVNRVYEKLEQKLDYDRYLNDIRLAVLNEYIEFVEASEDESQWYARHAALLAEDILKEKRLMCRSSECRK